MRLQFTGVPDRLGGIRRYAEDLASGVKELGIELVSQDADILHAVQPVMGLPTGKRFIVTVHDLAPLTCNRSFWFTPLFERRLRRSLERADAVIANSTQTAQELDEVFHSRYVDKIHLVDMGIQPKFSPPKLFRSHSLGCTRDCIPAAEKVASLTQRSLYPLLGARDERRLPEYEIENYYRALEYFIDFGRYRGFGYPIVEARACGTTVFTRTDARIPKEVKELTIQVRDEEEAAEKISAGVAQPELAGTHPFTLKRMVEQTVEVYHDVLSRL